MCETNLVRDAKNISVYIKNKKGKAKFMVKLHEVMTDI